MKCMHEIIVKDRDLFIDFLDADGLFKTIEAIKFLDLSYDIEFEDAYKLLIAGSDLIKSHRFERKSRVTDNLKLKPYRHLRSARDYSAFFYMS